MKTVRSIFSSGSLLIVIALAGFIATAHAAEKNKNKTQTTQSATSSGAATYGELMMIEKKEATVRPFQVELSGMQEFSNPYLDINGLSFSAKKSIGQFLYVGPEYTRYFARDSDVSKNVAQSLKSETISQTVFKPTYSLYGVGSLVPVAGHLNIFNETSMPFELEMSLGYGYVQYDKKPNEAAMLWRVGPRAFFSEAIGMQFQFGQELEAPFSSRSVTKSHARIGLIGRF